MTDNYTLIDIGINLCHESFNTDKTKVIERALSSNIKHMVITGSCESSSEAALALAKASPSHLSATAGIHPHHAKNVSTQTFDLLKALLKNPLVKAVGETGLDFYRNLSDPLLQEKAFIQHIELAKLSKKPLFLHQRDAHTRFYEILKSHRDDISQAVVHCFTDNEKALFQYLDLDLHIGMTGWICDEKRGSHLRPLISNIPLNRLMLETDSPYLLPKDLRPKPKTRRNEPYHLKHIATSVAEYYGCPLATLAEETTKTALNFFDIKRA